ncbi:MAG: hypothetical protein ACPGCJ_00470 [Flavobacteriaceae bacterium]
MGCQKVSGNPTICGNRKMSSGQKLYTHCKANTKLGKGFYLMATPIPLIYSYAIMTTFIV